MKRKIIVPKTVSQHIEEEFRKNPDLSQVELAKKVNSTQQTISRLEDLRNARINIKTLARLAVALRARLSIDFIPRELSV
jgi:transcriptional regulator with XRE-family HTH domain